MTRPKSDGKDKKLFDELCKAIGLLGSKSDGANNDGKLMVNWFLAPLATSRQLASSERRDHLLEAVASIVGDHDPLPGAAASAPGPWWFHVASKGPAGDRKHVPIDVVLADQGAKAIGVGARYLQAMVATEAAAKIGVALWIRAWLLGLAQAVPPPPMPLLPPTAKELQPQVEGEVRLDLPKGFLAVAALKAGLRLPAGDQPLEIAATVGLATRAAPTAITNFTIEVGAAGSSTTAGIQQAVRLAVFVARAFLEHAASKPGEPPNVARRLVDHLFPLLGGGTGNSITPFPIDDVAGGGAGMLTPWLRQFVPKGPAPADWNLAASATAAMHLYCLFKKGPPDPKALAGGSLVALLAGDAAKGWFGVHLDGDVDVGNKGWMSVGLVARTYVAGSPGATVRARIDVVATLARAAFDGYVVGGPAPTPPTLTGPSFDITLALEPVNGNQLVAIAIAGPTGTVSASIAQAKLTLRWRAGAGFELSWRFDSETDLAALAPATIAAEVIARLQAALVAALPAAELAMVRALVDEAQKAVADPMALLARAYALVPTVDVALGDIPLRLGRGPASAPPSLALSAGDRVTASVTATATGVTATVSADIPIPVPDDRLQVGLQLAASSSGALALSLRLGDRAAGAARRAVLALSRAALDRTYLIALVKHLVVPALTAAWLDADVLGHEVAAGITLGQILEAAGVIVARTGAGPAWIVRDVQELVARQAMQILADVTAMLARLRQTGVEVGDVVVKPTTTTTGSKTAYGVAMAAKGATTPPPTTTPPPPAMRLLDGPARVDLGGLDVTGLTIDGATPTFTPAIAIRDLALELGGPTDPLLTGDLLAVESVRLTTSLALGAADGLRVTKVGGQVTGLRLALGKDGGGLASSLMGKGAKDNPGFRLGFNSDLTATLPTLALDVGKTAQWVNLDLQLGPLSLQRFGVKVDKAVRFDAPAVPAPTDTVDHLYLLLDGGFALGPIAASASGLGVYFQPRHIATPKAWRFSLDGLGLALDAGPVALAGFLQRAVVDGVEEFRGAALIEVAGFQIGAVGAYRQIAGKPSLFVFGALDAPLGGPPFFFVTGVAGGFGVNRALVIPDDPAALKDHVFFKVMEGDQGSLASVGAMGDRIAAAMPAEAGTSWFAAGVKFTSFSLIKGVALLYLRFGKSFELGVLAKATFAVPQDDPTIASVTLVLKGAFTGGDDPRLLVRADLVDSWLLAKDCRLTGSFAFGLWPARGDCLLTVGGYHKDFKPPAHYPTGLSRLGFTWQISSAIKAEGQVYFALTPREAMAGASLSVAGTWGPLAAGFDAWFDAYIGWDPFWFDMTVGLRVWLRVFGIKASLGVNLQIWGPPIGGTATVEIAVWSFTIPFGEPKKLTTAPLSIGRFASKHLELALPAAAERATIGLAVRGRSRVGSGGAEVEPGSRGLITIDVARGAQAVRPGAPAATRPTMADGSKSRPLRVGPEFVLDVRSRVPVMTARYQDRVDHPLASSSTVFGLAPCQKDAVGSALAIVHGAGVTRIDPEATMLPPSPMPLALFGRSVVTRPPGADAPTTIALPTGVRIDGTARFGAAHKVRFTPELAGDDERIALPAGWGSGAPTPAPVVTPPSAIAVAPGLATPVIAAAVIGARISEAPVAVQPIDTTIATVADAHGLPELVIAVGGPRSPALADVVLHDLRPAVAPPIPSAIRAGAAGGDALVADGRALVGDGLGLGAGEALIVHDLGAGGVLRGRTDQPLQVVWIAGFGATLANLRVLADDRELALVAPAGVQRALIRALGRGGERDDDGAPPAGFDARTTVVRIGDRAWWAHDCMIGLRDGEIVDDQPTLARAGAVTRGASAVRLGFVPAVDVGPDGAPPDRDVRPAVGEPGRLLAISLVVDESTATGEPDHLGRWRRLEGELGTARAVGDGRTVTLTWRLDDEVGPCTVDVELTPGVRLAGAALVPPGRPDLRGRLLDDGRPLAFPDPARPERGDSRLRLAPVADADHAEIAGRALRADHEVLHGR